MKYIALSCLLVCSLQSAMANPGKSTLTMLLKKAEQVHNIKISYSPTQTDNITPEKQNIDSLSDLNRGISTILENTGMILKNQNGFYYLVKLPTVSKCRKDVIVEQTIVQRDHRPMELLSASYKLSLTEQIDTHISKWPVQTQQNLGDALMNYQPRWSIRTNMLLLFTGSLNAGIDYALNKQWSLGAETSYNPWSYGDTRIRHFLLRPEARYWFCQVNNGHFLRSGIQYMRYNIGAFGNSKLFSSDIRQNRYQGNNVGINIGYGYSWLIGKRFNIEVEFGLGVLYDSYTKYPCTQCGSALSKRSYVHLVPTDFAVNLVYILK